jgi:hypothetical protein
LEPDAGDPEVLPDVEGGTGVGRVLLVQMGGGGTDFGMVYCGTPLDIRGGCGVG